MSFQRETGYFDTLNIFPSLYFVISTRVKNL